MRTIYKQRISDQIDLVEFVVAIDEARVRFTDDAISFCLFAFFYPASVTANLFFFFFLFS
ncbi:hypothetical protein N7452_009998 [Penicillium brevicompactum]|uniref:Uncharacterized protein n=1 Tax=Penicillium brevicompactum TaxID=5074 RepID=A0A9W9QC41_PENBR|nr:hypothetical protein N7452_009998 [Penicillium brevicompactum]